MGFSVVDRVLHAIPFCRIQISYLSRLMKYVLAPFRFLYKIYFAIIFAVSMLLFFPFFVIAFQFKNGVRTGFVLKKMWSKFLEILLFVPLSVKGRSNFPKGQPYVIVANHASYLDIVLMYGVVPEFFLFLGKAEILKWPIINYVFGKMDIPVERGSITQAAKALELCRKEIDKGHSIAIFPEGGWDSKRAPKLQRFKNGAFKLAIEKQVPIVPVTFLDNYYLFSDQSDLFFNGRPGISRTIVHEPISTTGLTQDDLVSLRNQTHQLIKATFENGHRR